VLDNLGKSALPRKKTAQPRSIFQLEALMERRASEITVYQKDPLPLAGECSSQRDGRSRLALAGTG
jgi:hypothetical protein